MIVNNYEHPKKCAQKWSRKDFLTAFNIKDKKEA